MATNYFGGHNILIKKRDGRSTILYTAVVVRNRELMKAVIEAASIANPAIELSGAYSFGTPPYGIFSQK
jgi:hypothetical protein